MHFQAFWCIQGIYFGHCQPLSFSLSSLSDTIRSSTLYGPVTKVTVGKYFVQGANKGLIRWREGVKVQDSGKEKEVRIKDKKKVKKLRNKAWG